MRNRKIILIGKGEKMLNSKYNDEGAPFGVFCTNPECGNFLASEAHPMWSEDCPIEDGVLVCPACGKPVDKPQ